MNVETSVHKTATRVIPCLDIKGGRVVKGVRFEKLVDSGDPSSSRPATRPRERTR